MRIFEQFVEILNVGDLSRLGYSVSFLLKPFIGIKLH